MCDEEPTIVGQYFYIREKVISDHFYSPGFAGFVECRVGSDKYLIHTCKAKSRQHIFESEFFQEAQAQFFETFEELQEARSEFMRGYK